MNSCRHNDEGFTGLEAAIVLIAFVVVAAVFSYVVLGAGFFTTQKAQQTVHTSVGQATSAVELSGPVQVNTSTGNPVEVSFYLQLAAGGTPVDMSKVAYTVATPNRVQSTNWTPGIVSLTWVKLNTGESKAPGSDELLNERDMVLVDLNLNALGFSAANAPINSAIEVDVQPPIGAALTIQRTLPAAYTGGWVDVY